MIGTFPNEKDEDVPVLTRLNLTCFRVVLRMSSSVSMLLSLSCWHVSCGGDIVLLFDPPGCQFGGAWRYATSHAGGAVGGVDSNISPDHDPHVPASGGPRRAPRADAGHGISNQLADGST